MPREYSATVSRPTWQRQNSDPAHINPPRLIVQGGAGGAWPGLACCGDVYVANNNDLREEGLLPAWPSGLGGCGPGVPRGCLFPPPLINRGENELATLQSQPEE